MAFYERQLARHGPADPRSLHWISDHTQRVRFETLYRVGPWEGRTVADVGCGLGDLYGYLVARGHRMAPPGLPPGPDEVGYTGFDITPGLVDAAQVKYPTGHFLVQDVLEQGFPSRYDYAVASGTFNLRVARHHDYLWRALGAMWQASGVALAFNLLGPSGYADEEQDFYFGTAPARVLEFCRSLSERVELHQGYLTGDFTVFVYR